MPGTYEKIATTTLSSTASEISFASIPSTYTDIVMIVSGKSSSVDQIFLRYNTDTSTNYSEIRLSGNGTSAVCDRHSSVSYITMSRYGYPSNTAGENVSIFQFMNYANTTTYKTCLSRVGIASGGTDFIAGLWRSTAAIDTIKISTSGFSTATWQAGTTATIYGIKAA
jgi:hypothetical protein